MSEMTRGENENRNVTWKLRVTNHCTILRRRRLFVTLSLLYL